MLWMVVFFQQEVASRNKFQGPSVVLGKGQACQEANVQHIIELKKKTFTHILTLIYKKNGEQRQDI